MTVRQAEQRSEAKKKPGGKPAKDPNIADLETSISNRLGLKVQIIHKGDKGGDSDGSPTPPWSSWTRSPAV